MDNTESTARAIGRLNVALSSAESSALSQQHLVVIKRLTAGVADDPCCWYPTANFSSRYRMRRGYRFLSFDRGSIPQAPLWKIIKRSEMLDAPIIPENDGAGLPGNPTLDIRGLSDVIVKQLKQSATFSSIQL